MAKHASLDEPLTVDIPLKRCRDCQKDLPVTCFYLRDVEKQQRVPACKVCTRAYRLKQTGKTSIGIVKGMSRFETFRNNYRTALLCQCADCELRRPQSDLRLTHSGGYLSTIRRRAIIASRVMCFKNGGEWASSNQDDLPSDDEKEIEATVGIAIKRDRES